MASRSRAVVIPPTHTHFGASKSAPGILHSGFKPAATSVQLRCGETGEDLLE